MPKPKTRIRKRFKANAKDRIKMVVCPWCNEWEGPPEKYSDHLQYCKKYPQNIEAMKEQARVRPIETSSLRKTDAELREIARTLLPIELMFFKAGKGWMLDRLAGLSKEEFSRLEEIVQQMYSRKSPEQSARSPEELPPGMCYREAYRFVLKEGDHLIHGKITSPADKRVINHAWVEFNTGWVWEPQTEKFMRKSEFEQWFEPKVEAKYTPKEAATLALKSRHYGPWHSEKEEHSSNRSEGEEYPKDPFPFLTWKGVPEDKRKFVYDLDLFDDLIQILFRQLNERIGGPDIKLEIHHLEEAFFTLDAYAHIPHKIVLLINDAARPDADIIAATLMHEILHKKHPTYPEEKIFQLTTETWESLYKKPSIYKDATRFYTHVITRWIRRAELARTKRS